MTSARGPVPVISASVVGHEGMEDLKEMMRSIPPPDRDGTTPGDPASYRSPRAEVQPPVHYVLSCTGSDDESRPYRFRVFRTGLDPQGRPHVQVGVRIWNLDQHDERWLSVPAYVATPVADVTGAPHSEYGDPGVALQRVTWDFRDFYDPLAAQYAFIGCLPVHLRVHGGEPDANLPFWASLLEAISRSCRSDPNADTAQMVVACLSPQVCDIVQDVVT